ncbi:MAG: flagellar biosynthesis protein FlgN, partial [Spirochaetaceae bacterium]|nr:flagellar biosynthesis protein FlgN [Spirochaetaceae bacterium]
MSVLKRFKELLIEQRQRLHSYIEILDKQKDIIGKGKTEDLLAHVELEENVVAGIAALQKSIEPLRSIYELAAAGGGDNGAGVLELNITLEKLKTEAARRADDNKVLLQKRMALLRDEIKNLRSNPYAKRKSIYTDNQSATLFDISG